jgi:predicted Zn-dependent protease
MNKIGSKCAIIGFIFSILFFVPLSPFVGLFLSLFYLAKGDKKLKGLAIVSIVLSLIFIIVQVIIFFGVLFFYMNMEEIEYKSLLYSLNSEENDQKSIIYLNDFLDDSGVNEKYFELLIYRGILYEKIGEDEKALDDYEASIFFIEGNLDNVMRSYYSYVYFYAGLILSEKNDTKSIEYAEEGLKLSPNDNINRIYLGQIYQNLGKNTDALNYYLKLNESDSLNTEERVIIKMSIDKLNEKPNSVNLLINTYNPNININIYPLNNLSTDSFLDNLCKLLSYKFRMKCNVMEEIKIEESLILNSDRNMYDAEKIIEIVNSSLGIDEDKYNITILFTGKGIYTNELDFIFSRQYFDKKIGVISSDRFEKGLPILPEKDKLLVRRLGIQFISTVGQLVGLKRATDPSCPLAYPNSLNDFYQKTSKICFENQAYIDETRSRFSVSLISFKNEELKAIEKVYQDYYFE